MLKFLCFCLFLICQALSQQIERDTKEYFGSELIKNCEKTWSKYRLAFEDSLSKSLTGYGRHSMNLYIKRSPDSLLLTDGYYHSDNQVEMIFQEVLLESLPRLVGPELEFNLCANVLKIKSLLSPMIIHAPYMLFRNSSSIIYAMDGQNTKSSSPFRFEQVKNIGSITITADNCFLSGIVLTSLDGSSVTVKHNSFNLSGCDYDIEIYEPGQRTPPVMANYLFDGNGLNLQDLLTRVINREFLPQMQAAMFAYVGTSDIFGDDVSEIEKQQKILFAKSEGYMTHVLRQVNNYLIQKDSGSVDMKNFQVHWDDSFEGTKKKCKITLSDMKLFGLESAYTAHVGGPFNLSSVQIMEQVKLSSLQVIGKVGLGDANNCEYRFAADIYDAAIDVILNVNKLQQKLAMVLERRNEETNNNYMKKEDTDDKNGHVFKVVGWRAMDFSCPSKEELPIESIVTGYLLTELPKYITSPLETAFKSAIRNMIVDDGDDFEKPVPVAPDNGLSEENENVSESEYSREELESEYE